MGAICVVAEGVIPLTEDPISRVRRDGIGVGRAIHSGVHVVENEISRDTEFIHVMSFEIWRK